MIESVASESQWIEKVVQINRVAKVVKGGRRFRFSALVIVGDGNGKVGYGLGKAHEVPVAIHKAIDKARRMMKQIPIINATIPYEVLGRYGSGRVLLKPAYPGTGIIAGGTVRAVMEASGIHNILTKCIGSNNPHNVVKATFEGLKSLKTPEAIAKKRGKEKAELL